MKKLTHLGLFFAATFFAVRAAFAFYAPPRAYYDINYGVITAFGGGADSTTSAALHMDDARFADWADGWLGASYGANCAAEWRTPQKATGKAVGNSYDIVCLGEGGSITMSFSNTIKDGDGYDFAVFENSFSDYFLELAFVEVSSDGVHFVRFPNLYLGSAAIGAQGLNYPTNIYNLGSKYKQGYGNPYDLAELAYAYAYSQSASNTFTETYKAHLAANMPYLDVANVRYVRLVDIAGGGTTYDAEGYPIYDPTPCTGSAGFDLEAIGVINSNKDLSKLYQSVVFDAIADMKFTAGATVVLNAYATSGLGIAYSVIDGDAAVSGNILTLGTTPSTVVVKAAQAGNSTYQSAVAYQSFTASNTSLQTINFPALADRTPSQGQSVYLYASASSGLAITYYVSEGDGNILTRTGGFYFKLTTATAPQVITIRATQEGNGSYTAATPAERTFAVVNKQTFAAWTTANSASAYNADQDADGYQNLFEYAFGTNPALIDTANLPAVNAVNGNALISWRVRAESSDVSSIKAQISIDGAAWTDLTSNLVSTTIVGSNVFRSYSAKAALPSYGNFKVRFVGTLADASTATSAEISQTLAQDFESWAAAAGFFDADAAEDASPLEDGITNLEKYALKIDPTKPADLTGIFKTSVANGTASFGYPVFKYAEGLAVKAYSSADLINWTLETSTKLETSSYEACDEYTVQKSVPAGGRIFFKLEISR